MFMVHLNADQSQIQIDKNDQNNLKYASHTQAIQRKKKNFNLIKFLALVTWWVIKGSNK